MSNHLDELASAYYDGEATPSEIALVESDPEIMGRVQEMYETAQQVAQDLPAPATDLRATHLSAAMASFDPASIDMADSDPAADGEASASADSASDDSASDDSPGDVSASADSPEANPDNVRTLSDPSRAGEPASTQNLSPNTEPAKGVTPVGQAEYGRRIPRWLGLAAGVIFLAGGVGLAATLLNSGNNDTSETETASNPVKTTVDADSAVSAAQDRPELAKEESATLEDSLKDSPASSDESAGSAARSFDAELPEPVELTSVPNSETLSESIRNSQLSSPELSQCASTYLEQQIDISGFDPETETLGFLPAILDNQAVEIVSYLEPTGQPMAQLLDRDCELINP